MTAALASGASLEARWPFASADVPPVPILIRRSWSDFRVRELPHHEPDGDGDHLLMEVEKRGISTPAAVRDLARALGVRPRDIGVAGLKDTRAITRQRMSVEHVDPEVALGVRSRRLRVVAAWRTRRKLRTGQLAGNAFRIRLRAPEGGGDIRDRLADIAAVLERLSTDGVPNYFGAQRFGMRGDNHLIGMALLRGDFEEAAARIAGRPEADDRGDILRARTLFAEGRYDEAAAAWPRGNAEAARVARARGRGRDARGAVLAAGQRLLRFYVSALQSALFNDVLALRVDDLASVEVGDVAWVHDGERVFVVEDASATGERARRGSVSATGPLFGPRMLRPAGDQAERERAVLRDAGLSAEDFGRRGPWGTPGGRRPLRIPRVRFGVDGGEDAAGPYVRLRFRLPPGAYATAVLREIAKGRLEVGTARAWQAAQ
ncbi:MAG TPA: tRNA pseudouridine(13) synthase TruD [Longimicrobiales bacterium]|nr:tRNA pseudouridine(13) synthase TruD [Longimicrobiales bacterium]